MQGMFYEDNYKIETDDIVSELEKVPLSTENPMNIFIKDKNNKDKNLSLLMGEDRYNSLHFRNTANPYEVLKVLDVLKGKGIKIFGIKLDVENKDYDTSFLEELDNNYDLWIDYKGGLESCSYDDFSKMREAINYYKNVINENELSPMEKYFYAYDIVKSLEYKENEKDRISSRDIHGVISSGNIVCVGYAKLLSQILNELNIKAMPVSVEVREDNEVYGHERCLVKIDDDKYNYHGLFSSDPTWDSRRENLALVQEDNIHTIIAAKRDDALKNYDGTLLYNHYIVPVKDYRKNYEDDTMPYIFQAYVDSNLDVVFKEFTFEEKMDNFMDILKEKDTKDINPIALKEEVNYFFGKASQEEVEKYLYEPSLSIQKKNELMRVVKKCEGYSDELIDTTIRNSNEIYRIRTGEDELNIMFEEVDNNNLNYKNNINK